MCQLQTCSSTCPDRIGAPKLAKQTAARAGSHWLDPDPQTSTPKNTSQKAQGSPCHVKRLTSGTATSSYLPEDRRSGFDTGSIGRSSEKPGFVYGIPRTLFDHPASYWSLVLLSIHRPQPISLTNIPCRTTTYPHPQAHQKQKHNHCKRAAKIHWHHLPNQFEDSTPLQIHAVADLRVRCCPGHDEGEQPPEAIAVHPHEVLLHSGRALFGRSGCSWGRGGGGGGRMRGGGETPPGRGVVEFRSRSRGASKELQSTGQSNSID